MQTSQPSFNASRQLPRALTLAAVAALLLFTAPASPSCTIPSGFKLGSPGNSTYGFFTNFASTPTLLSTYAVSLGGGSTTSTAGDLNALYTHIYYSVANMINSWTSSGNCAFELVLVGTFPDSRYFAVVDNDAHYANTQHIADLAMDPVQYTTTGGPITFQNQFVVGLGTGGGSLSYEAGQYFMVPISLGTIPSGANTTAGCGIPPFEGDNLLDATQRHSSMDWNPTVNPTSPTGYPLLPSVGEINSFAGYDLGAHTVDTPEHTTPSSISGDVDGWNPAGSIIIRNYLQPPLSCSGSSGALSCSATVAAPSYYLLIRDANSGCAYEITTELQDELFYNNLSSGNNGASAIVSTSNPATSSYLPSSDEGYWMDATQKGYHSLVSNTTPQACFANGGTSSGNICAWARGPEYETAPGPEDAYIGANVNYSQLQSIGSNNGSCTTSCNYSDYQVLLFQFAMPNPTPDTPCIESGGSYPCYLTGSEPLRYMSLTFEQEQSSGSVQPLISIADSAFATTLQTDGQYLVDLVLNVSGTLPSWLQPPSNPWSGAPVGFSPVLVNPTGSSTYATYPVWQVTAAGTNYTVLDLTTIPNTTSPNALSSSGASINVPALSIGTGSANDLPIQMRTTLPAGSFGCAGQSVPYSTAVYTGGSGEAELQHLDGALRAFCERVDAGRYCDGAANGKPAYVRKLRANAGDALLEYSDRVYRDYRGGLPLTEVAHFHIPPNPALSELQQ